MNIDDVHADELQKEGFRDSHDEADDMLVDHDSTMLEAMEEQHKLAWVEDDGTVEFKDQNAIILQKGPLGQCWKFLKHPPTGGHLIERKQRMNPYFLMSVILVVGMSLPTMSCCFSAKGEKKYVKQVIPTGANPVAKVDEKHLVGSWEFFYGGWNALCYKADESADESKKWALVKRLKVK
jgi:hypothetical protein